MTKFKERVKELTRRQQPRSVREMVRLLHYRVRGFGTYFHVADVKGLFAEVDGWIRCFIERKKVVKHQNYRIPNAALIALGLVSLLEFRAEYLLLPITGQPYRKAAYGKSVRTV